MARFWPIYVAVLFAFLASTANTASTKDLNPMTRKRAFIEKLKEFVSLADRGFQTVGSSVKTLYEKFDLISKLIVNKIKSSVRDFELLEDTQEPVDATPQPDLSTTRQVVTAPEPDVTTPKGIVTTSQPDVTTTRQEVTTPEPDFTTPKGIVTTSQPDVTTTKQTVTTSKPAAPTPKIASCGSTWRKNGTSYIKFCACRRACSVNRAGAECIKKNARLVTAKTFARQWFITSILKTMRILLGGNDRDEEGTWRWPDGSLINESSTNWDRGQPKATTKKNCMALNRFWALWTAESCTHPFQEYRTGFACERTRL